MAKVIKPMASDYIDLKNYIADMQSYYKAMGKSPYKVAPHVYKEMGIYSIQDLHDKYMRFDIHIFLNV